MKAVQILTQGEIKVVEIEKPRITNEEVLLKIEYAGFCGSDLNTYRGGNPMVKMPVIPGHEIGAVIEATGANVPQDLQAGMHVTVNPYTACGKCASCRNGRFNACEHNETLGVQRNGAMCEYVALPWSKIIPVGSLSTQTSALIEPMSVGTHAVSRGEVSSKDIVMVVGCGMVGLGAVAAAAHRGATVIAADIDDEKLALAKESGATYTVNTLTENVHEKIGHLTNGMGADVVIEAVGSPATYVMAINEVSFCGRVVYIGYAKQEVSFQTKLFVQKELDIRGTRNATPTDFQTVIELLTAGNVPTDKYISKIVAPEETPQAMAYWQQNPGKVFRILVTF